MVDICVHCGEPKDHRCLVCGFRPPLKHEDTEMKNYKGYLIETLGAVCLVYHPNHKLAVYATETLKDAKRFVDAYRAGTIWAVQAFATGVPILSRD